MTVIAFLVTVILVPMLLTEFTDWLPWAATQLMRRALAELPAERRSRYAEEWAAEFSALPGGKLTKVAFCFRLYVHARATGTVLREEQKAEQEGEDALDTAARVLALAQQTANQAIIDARREADETLSRARYEADAVLASARRQAEKIVQSARNATPERDRTRTAPPTTGAT